jgi:hypothetical protein
MKKSIHHKHKCTCCGKREKIRKLGRQVLTNICHALGVCGRCLMTGKA